MNNKPSNINIEYQTSGKFGNGKIILNPKGARQVEMVWKGKPPFFTTSAHVDLESLKCKNLKDGVHKACHFLGFLPCFQTETIKGPKALVTAYYQDSNKKGGYASITKSGSKSLRFSLDRIDLNKMQCQCPHEALKKTAFITGSIKLVK